MFVLKIVVLSVIIGSGVFVILFGISALSIAKQLRGS